MAERYEASTDTVMGRLDMLRSAMRNLRAKGRK